MKKMVGNRRPKNEVVRALHISMVILCLMASVALFFLDSIFNRVIISVLLIAYAIFLLKNTHILLLIFKLSLNECNLFPTQQPQIIPKFICGTPRNQQMKRTKTSKNKR